MLTRDPRLPDFVRPQAPPISPKEARFNSIQEKFKGLDPDRLRQVLNALPNEPDPTIAAMVSDPELFSKVQQANLKLEMQRREAEGKQGQASLFGDEPLPGRLFNTVEQAIVQEYPYARGLETETIQKRLGENGTVKEIKPEGDLYTHGWSITTKEGMGIRVLVSKENSLHLMPEYQGRSEQQFLNEDYTKKGQSFKPGDMIAGAYTPVRTPFGFEAMIELARGAAPRTIDHEFWHMVEDFFLTNREYARMVRKYGDNAEDRADAYMNWDPKKAPDTVFQKILDFAKTVIKAITGYRSVDDIFEDVRSGKIFERKPVEWEADGSAPKNKQLPEGLAPAKLSVQRGTPPEDALLGVRGKEDSAETRQEWTPESPMSYKRFGRELLKDNEALKTRLTSPGNQEIPLYVGERFTDRAGNQIVDPKGRVRFLNDQEIWERFYKPQRPLINQTGGTQATPPNPLLPPEGTVEPPPNKKPGWLEPVRRSLKEKISVNTISKLAKSAHESLVEHMGWAAREQDKAKEVLDKYMPLFDKMDQDAVNRFTDLAEDGEKNLAEAVRNGELSPEHLEAAQAWRRLSDGFHFLIADEKGGLFSYWKDYFPRMAKNPEMAQEIIANYLASHGRRGGGAAGFLEARKILKTSTLFKPKLFMRDIGRGSFQGLPVPVQRVSTHAQGLRLRGVPGRLAMGVAHDVAFPLSEQGRHAGKMISELNGWPACAPVNASPAMLPWPAHDSGPDGSLALSRTALSSATPCRF